VLKHDWSHDDLEREVRANLVYRAFTRIDAEVPDAKTILKIARALGPAIIELVESYRTLIVRWSAQSALQRSQRPCIVSWMESPLTQNGCRTRVLRADCSGAR